MVCLLLILKFSVTNCMGSVSIWCSDYSGRVGPTIWWDQPVVPDVRGWGTVSAAECCQLSGGCPASGTHVPALGLREPGFTA